METPVLLLIFNRPDLAERVFASIKKAKPAKIFIAADGPREHKDGEAELCKQTRSIVLDNIDWDCEVHTLLRDKNLGCKVAVSTAITWFFENVEAGIILEDDTLPDVSFFNFCGELLEKYKDDSRVSFISGTCIPNSADHLQDSYYYSKFSIIWGWASWRRVWKNYDVTISDWPQLAKSGWLRNVFYGNDYFAKGFGRFFDSAYNGYDTWDFQFFFLNLKNNSLNIHPTKNLIKNIGFDERATHTHSKQSYSDQEVQKIGALKHPPAMYFDYTADEAIFNALYAYTEESWQQKTVKKIKSKIKSIIK